jgi:hypothetical protein
MNTPNNRNESKTHKPNTPGTISGDLQKKQRLAQLTEQQRLTRINRLGPITRGVFKVGGAVLRVTPSTLGFIAMAPHLMDLPEWILNGGFSDIEKLTLLFVVIGAAAYALNICMSLGDTLNSKWEKYWLNQSTELFDGRSE